jgi:hypothetical protein
MFQLLNILQSVNHKVKKKELKLDEYVNEYKEFKDLIVFIHS